LVKDEVLKEEKINKEGGDDHTKNSEKARS
jgi:hypothetical protein